VVLDRCSPRRIRLACEHGYDEEVVTENSAVGTILSRIRRCVQTVPFLVLEVVAVLLGLAVVSVLYLLVRRWLPDEAPRKAPEDATAPHS
jgi:hypothetical protein